MCLGVSFALQESKNPTPVKSLILAITFTLGQLLRLSKQLLRTLWVLYVLLKISWFINLTIHQSREIKLGHINLCPYYCSDCRQYHTTIYPLDRQDKEMTFELAKDLKQMLCNVIGKTVHFRLKIKPSITATSSLACCFTTVKQTTFLLFMAKLYWLFCN